MITALQVVGGAGLTSRFNSFGPFPKGTLLKGMTAMFKSEGTTDLYARFSMRLTLMGTNVFADYQGGEQLIKFHPNTGYGDELSLFHNTPIWMPLNVVIDQLRFLTIRVTGGAADAIYGNFFLETDLAVRQEFARR